MGKLVLLRHGESVWNKKNVFTGWVNIGLSEGGIEEARKAGKELKKFIFDAVYVSTLIRAQMTVALALADQMLLFPGDGEWDKSYGESEFIPVIESAALNERYYGKLQGKNKDAIRQEFGEEQFRLWRRSYDVPPPEGESLKMTIERTLPYCKKEIFPRVEKGETILICAHGNSIRGIVMYLDGLSEEEIVQCEIPTGVPLIYDLPR